MIEVNGVSVSYVADIASEPDVGAVAPLRALDGVTCSFRAGEIVSLAGLNGSGKSTLSRLLCAMRLPDAGSVIVDGVNPADGERERLAVRASVGFVQQDPVDQIVSTLVFDEVAFGPRNLGLDEEEVERRVERSLIAVGLAGFDSRDVNGLSGGEQQRLALAGVLAMEPGYLVLDEATSHLDSAARPAFRSLVESLAHRRGLGVIQVTHDPMELLASDRVMVLEHGRIVWQGAPDRLLLDRRDLWDSLTLESLYVSAVEMALEGGADLACVRTPQRLYSWLQKDSVAFLGDCLDTRGPAWSADEPSIARGTVEGPRCPSSRCGIEVCGVSFAYDSSRLALDSVSLTASPGKIMLLAGRSGSGKSTLAMLLAGLSFPDAGRISVDGEPPAPARCGLAFQRPENQLFLQTVRDEIAFAPRNAGVDEEDLDERVRLIAQRVGLEEGLLDRSPFELSGGQARRVGLACVLSLSAGAYVLDEPTAGLDAPGRLHLHRLVRDLANDGATVILISHDLDEWICDVDDVALMAGGRIAWTGAARELWNNSSVYRAAGIEPPEGALLLDALRGGALADESEGSEPWRA